MPWLPKIVTLSKEMAEQFGFRQKLNRAFARVADQLIVMRLFQGLKFLLPRPAPLQKNFFFTHNQPQVRFPFTGSAIRRRDGNAIAQMLFPLLDFLSAPPAGQLLLDS